LVEGIFVVQNNGAMREELEVALETLNGNPFRGTLTFLEAKHGIFGDCLGLGGNNFNNFDGVRFAFKGCPVAIFKMKEAINVDELLAIQYFDFNRRSTRQGRAQVDTISCKIRGLRSSINKVQSRSPEATSAARQDDGTRAITIEGCDYRVPKEILINFLSCYGEVVSDVLEVVFNDNLTGGGNRTGSYSVTVKLHCQLPQLAPIMGKKVSFNYRGVQKLCHKCFGPHPKKTCQSSKKLWMEYVDHFISLNPDVPDDCYGRWLDIINKAKDPTINMRREAAHSTGAISNEINNQSEGAGDSAVIAQDLGHLVQTAEEEQATVISVDPIVHSGETSSGGAAAEWLIKG
jgi:hypothetical protein